jgi:hypothetical protein
VMTAALFSRRYENLFLLSRDLKSDLPVLLAL